MVSDAHSDHATHEQPAGLKARVRMLLNAIVTLLPKNRWGDKMAALQLFLRAHRRWPQQRQMLNDVLYQMRVSGEIVDPLRVFVSDKEFVKLYVAAVVGDEHNVPTLAVLRRPEDVDTFAFPADCCIKPTHASQLVILRRNNAPLALDEIKRWFFTSLYRQTRETNYRDLKPKVIVEPILEFESGVLDFKVFCYEGEPKLIQVGLYSPSVDRRRYYDTSWREVKGEGRDDTGVPQYEKPDDLEGMLLLSKALSARFSLVRIDLYRVAGKWLIGEITNCHWGASDRFFGYRFEQVLSQMIFGRQEG